MRTTSIAALLVLTCAWAAPVNAQTTNGCHAVSPTSPVVMSLNDGTTLRGTLLCLTGTDAVLATDGDTTMTPLASVRRIVTRRDPVWDGFVKGFAVPTILLALCSCEATGEAYLRAGTMWGLIGLVFDALQGNQQVMYGNGRIAQVGAGRGSVQWRVRF